MKEREKTTSPILLLGFMNIIGFGLLALMRTNLYDGVKTLITGALFMLLMMICYCLIKLLHMGDVFLFMPVTALLSIGLLMLTRIKTEYGEKQMIWFCIALLFYFAAFTIYKAVAVRNKLFFLYGGASVLLFVLTLTIGRNINGAKNWIYLGSQGFQPSELIRILFILGLACLFDRVVTGEGLFKSEIRKSFVVMLYVYMNLGFLILQREWGIAVLFFLIYMAMLFAFGSRMRIMALNIFIALLGGLAGYKVMYHIQTRVAMWLDPFSDPSGRGYQIVQSLIAMASGGFVGSGFGNGSPECVPFVESDFIFSLICEEFGLLGGIGVILLFFILAYRGFKITLSTRDSFDKKVALGITVMFSFQTFIILGGVIKLIPLTGITLPFISYGGSSLVTNFMALGILQAISVKESDSLE